MPALPADPRTFWVAFDADDTLWHNESIYAVTQQRFRDLLVHCCEPEQIDARLLATEKRNLRLFGYGIKGFTLSMIETAIEITDGRVGAAEIQSLIDSGKWMLTHPVDLLAGVHDTIEALHGRCPLLLITKGDLFDQESKIARSGIAHHFSHIEIVAEKDVASYLRILEKYDIDPARFAMVGNSVRSDILPVLELGGHAIHVPYEITWAHEAAEAGPHERMRVVPHMRDVAGTLEEIFR